MASSALEIGPPTHLMRAFYIDLISNIQEHDQEEARAKADAISWIQSGEPLTRTPGASPSPNEKHFVCYFPLIDIDSESLFLVQHRKAGLWLPPGGHIEDNEAPLDAVARECREELGITARFLNHHPFFISSCTTRNTSTPHTDIAFWYVLISTQTAPLYPDKREFSLSEWFPLSKPPTSAMEINLPRFIEKLQGSDDYKPSAATRAAASRLMCLAPA